MVNQDWTTVSIKKSTLEMLKRLSDITHISMSQLIEDYLVNLMSVASTFKSLNLQYESDALADSLTITCFGKQSFVAKMQDGHVSDREIYEEGKKLLENGEK